MSFMRKNFGNILALAGMLAASGAAYVAYAADKRVEPVEDAIRLHVAKDEEVAKRTSDVLDAIWVEMRIQNKRTMALCQATPGAVCKE